MPPLESASAVPDRPSCPMPYYPDAGVDQVKHSQDAKKYFYVVKEGRVKGTFTNDEVARLHTTRFSGACMRAVAHWEDAIDEWRHHCVAHHGDICPDAPVVAAVAAPSRAPSPASSLSSIGSVDSMSSMNSSSTARTEAADFAWQLPHGPPSIQSTRVRLPNHPTQPMFWGVPGVMRTFSTRAEAVAAAHEQGIARPNVWGHNDQHVMADFILSGEQTEQRKSKYYTLRAARCRGRGGVRRAAWLNKGGQGGWRHGRRGTRAVAVKPVAICSRTCHLAAKPKQKPGNKGDFHGLRYDFLISELAGYMDASRNGKTRSFWPGFFEKYWAKFNWRLSLDQDPVEGATWPDEDSLSDDELHKKSQTQLFLKAKIKTWYNHHRSAMGISNNPYTPWLARLRRPDEPSPKRTTDYQFYMRHDDYKKAVDDEFKLRHWDEPRHNHLALRCKIAREMFDLEPDVVKDRIRQEALEEHEDEMQQWRDAEEGLPSVNEEDQKEARLRFSAVVSPLLKALRAYTGYHITLIGGRLVGNKVDLVSVHAGTTKTKDGVDNGKDFTEWNQEGYSSQVLAQFVRYLVQPLLPPNASLPLPSSVPSAPRPASPTPPARQATPPAPGSVEERMARLAVLESPLRRELDAMTAEQREARVVELGALNAMTLQRENNMARNRAGAKAVAESVAAEVTAKQAETKKPVKRKRGAVTQTKKKPKRARRAASEEEDSAIESGTDASEGEREEPPRTRATNRAACLGLVEKITPTHAPQAMLMPSRARTRQVLILARWVQPMHLGRWERVWARAPVQAMMIGRGTGTGASAADVSQVNTAAVDIGEKGNAGAKGKPADGVPKWVTEAQKGLKIIASDGGEEEWMALTNLWYKLEASTNFTTGKSLPSKGRPRAVAWWIQRARKGTPPIADVEEFAEQWREWWRVLNPEWRVGDKGKMRREGGSDWGALKVPGVNGLLSVLMCLKWWKGVLAAGAGDSGWKDAVDDVTWVYSS
ncbi:hypothetical protein B0H13DRAFT_1901814 [Mycena leptocephala]|nr:hypothetical protein B0H13DRAFT_1901814 [Mycena leptocephala]